MRRTKTELLQMENTCKLYLLEVKNDPHKAYDNFIKENLISGLPYYIKGIKDFIKVSQILAVELNRVDQMKKADKQRAASKEEIINKILSLSLEEIKSIYKEYKDKGTNADKLILVDMYHLKNNNELNKKAIDERMINTFSNLNIFKPAGV